MVFFNLKLCTLYTKNTSNNGRKREGNLRKRSFLAKKDKYYKIGIEEKEER